MLPKTKQAVDTEVEGDMTVTVTGYNADGESLKDLQAADALENKTADQGSEEEPTGQEPQQTAPDKGSEPTQPEKQPTRYERRTEKLIDKLKEKTDSESELRRQLGSMGKTSQEAQPQLPPWLQNQAVPQGELTPEEYQAHVTSAARGIVQTEMASFQENLMKYEGFKEDLTTVESKYPILNPDSGSYDPDKAKTVAQLFQKASASDPKLRLSEFVEQIMSFHQAGQEVGKKELTTEVIRRDAEAAVTPNPMTGDLPSSASEKDWDSMTLPQKEAWMKAQGIWDE